ncbi:DNA-binding protein [Streptomyces sp. NPDC020917]|uniref:DNA-binding protein n=1 Tax=Streptomyces sp. NPDC020917 TaxID=3365102 RepID=UPI0037AEEC10
MDTPAQEPTTRAQEAMELQRGWYGEPLGDLFRRLIADLGLQNQVRLAGVLGLSAPMLSQLMSGQRAKIGNPAVVQRLQMLQELAWQVTEGSTGAMEAAARMDQIKKWGGASVLSTTHSGSVRSATASPREVVHGIQTVLRSVASADEIADASRALAPAHPRLAEFLRVYGTGRTGDALEHYKSHQD